MYAIDAVLTWVQLAEWVLLAVAAWNLWRKRRDASSSWLALTFASLASVVVAGMFLGEETSMNEGASFWLIKGLIAVIVLFPYLLFRFLTSMVERQRWVWLAAHLLTGSVVVITFALPSFPEPGDPRPAGFQAWMYLFFAQWTFLLVHVAWRLLRAGRHQPAVARKRMRMMGIGAFLLAAVLVVSAFGSQTEEITASEIVIGLVSLLAGPFFLFGFAPPHILRTHWRRKEELDLRQMEIGLVGALSREEIAEAFVPAVVDLLGGRGAVLIDAEGTVLGQRGLSDAEVAVLRDQAPLASDHYEALEVGQARIIPMETGWLAVMSGPFTPFFGTDELQMLSAAAVLADLALGRAKLYDLETQSREAMRDFVAIASHDLRTPVTVIQGFSQLLSEQWDDVTDEKKRDYATAINRQVQQLDRLIRDLLTVSKLDVNEVEVAAQRVDVLQTVDQVVHAVADGIEVTVTGDGGCPMALADPDHVARMLQNYIKNALIYGEAPFRVDVEARAGWITVCVRDGGVGVPETFMPNLFEKFARVDKKKSKAVQGTGLGLSIVRGLARANGGEAWYEPRDGEGACFAFRIPAASQDAATPLLELKGTA